MPAGVAGAAALAPKANDTLGVLEAAAVVCAGVGAPPKLKPPAAAGATAGAGVASGAEPNLKEPPAAGAGAGVAPPPTKVKASAGAGAGPGAAGVDTFPDDSAAADLISPLASAVPSAGVVGVSKLNPAVAMGFTSVLVPFPVA